MSSFLDQKKPAIPEIIFVGRSNVGKSTIVGQLTGKKVRKGKRPGVTLKPNSILTKNFIVTDMPGFGFMSGVKDRKQDIVKEKIVKYIERNNNIKLGVLVLDGSSFLDIVERWKGRDEIPLDIELYDFLSDLSIPIIIAINKKDKLHNLDETVDGIIQEFDLLPPWRQWLDNIAIISGKQKDIGSLKKLIYNKI